MSMSLATRRSPHLASLFVALGLASVAALPLSAQRAPDPVPDPEIGDRVRVEWVDEEGADRQAEGRLMGTAGGEVAIEGAHREVTVIPIDRIEAFQRRSGTHPVFGALLGGAAGLALGVALVPGCDDCIVDGSSMLAALGGGVLGMVVGARLVGQRQWTDVPIPGSGPVSGPTPIVRPERLQASSGVSVRVGLRWPVGR